LPELKIHRLWELIEPFAAYGFNKAHAAPYGIVAYQTSYMKAHYPVQYMTAVLQAEAGDAEKVAAIVHECHRLQIEVMPPDVNESFRNFAMVSKPGEPGRIRFGLTAIKNVGEHICEVIYRERKENGQYKDLEDFLQRIQDKDLNKKSVESLIQAGAMDGFGHDRGVLLANSENILYFVKQSREKNIVKQDSLFSSVGLAFDSKVTLKSASLATMDEKLIWEKNLLGLYVSSHPFAYFQEVLKKGLVPLNEVENAPRDGWVVIGGVIDSLKKKITKKGSVMMFATIQDLTGSMELLVFPKTYEQTQAIWQLGAVVCIVGKTPKEEGDNKVFVEKINVLTKENASEVGHGLSLGTSVKDYAPQAQDKAIQINLNSHEAKEKAGQLKEIFVRYPGEYHVYAQVGDKSIRTQAMVEWNDALVQDLTALLGEGKIKVFE